MGYLELGLLVSMPILTGLQRFAVAYGYQRLSKHEARREAVLTGGMVAMMCGAIALWR